MRNDQPDTFDDKASETTDSRSTPCGPLLDADAAQRLAEIIDFLPDATFVIDQDKRVVAWNQACEVMTGVHKEALLGRGDYAYSEPFVGERRPILIDLVDRPLSDIEALYKWVHRDGDVVFAESFMPHLRDGQGAHLWGEAAPLFDRQGRRCGAIEVVRDVTEQKIMEAALRESEQRYRTLFETAGDAILLMQDHRFVDCNARSLVVYGCTREQLVGQSPDHFSPPIQPDGRVSSEASREKIHLALTIGPQFFEWEHWQADRTPFFAEVSLTRMDLGGDVLVQAIVRDVTERKMAAEATRRLEEQLRSSQKMEAIGSLAGGVAHDFNNLLSVILSHVDFAVAALPEGHPVRDDLEEIQKAGQRASGLTRQLLAFGRKQMLEPRVLQLNQVVGNLQNMLQRLIGEHIDLALKLDPDLWTIKADAGQIEQVIMNLVLNARDAMPDGGKLTIDTANVRVDEGYADQRVAATLGPHVCLAISDTGCGMDAATRERMFDPFFSTKDKNKGTGLGLSTVYGIVKQSGGSIWTYSEPGRGTTIKVFLPRAGQGAAPDDVEAVEPEKPIAGDETILLVEDEESVRGAVTRMLRTAGYHVLTAANGNEALRVGAQYPDQIDLLLTDVVMPDMSGRQLAERLLETRPHLAVLYTSGYTDSAIVRHGVLEPGTAFIGKPFSAARLTWKVRETLTRTQQSVSESSKLS